VTDLHPEFDAKIDRREVPALKWHSMVLGEDGADLFPAGVADMDFKAPEPIRAAMQKRLDHGVFGYETVPCAMMPAITEWYTRRYSWNIDQAHILRAPNVLNTLAIAVSLFSEPGNGIIMQPPVFFDFYDVIRENNRTIVENPLILTNGRYGFDFKGLETMAARPENKILLLCNPHNPVGRVWTGDELRQIGDICNRHGVLVVSDEIHGDFTFRGHNYTPYAALGPDYANNSVICISPAKSFNIAACTPSYTVVSNTDKRAAFQAENSRLTVNKNNAFANVAVVAAYQECEPWLEAAIAYVDGNLKLVRESLSGIEQVDLIEPEGTFLVWLDFRALGFESQALHQFLRDRAGWAVTQGIAFGKQGCGFARLNIACRRAQLESALGQLRKALEGL